MKKILYISNLLVICVLAFIGCNKNESEFKSHLILSGEYYLHSNVFNCKLSGISGSNSGFIKSFAPLEIKTVIENQQSIQMLTFSQPQEITLDYRIPCKGEFFGPPHGSYILEKVSAKEKYLLYPCALTGAKETIDKISYDIVKRKKHSDWDPLANKFTLNFNEVSKTLTLHFDKKDVGHAEYIFESL